MNVQCSMGIAVKSAPTLMEAMSAHVVMGINLMTITSHAVVSPNTVAKVIVLMCCLHA